MKAKPITIYIVAFT